MRRRRSMSASSGTSMRKGRIALPSAARACVGERPKPPVDAELARPKAPAAAAVASKLRRVGDEDRGSMIILLGWKHELGGSSARARRIPSPGAEDPCNLDWIAAATDAQ